MVDGNGMVNYYTCLNPTIDIARALDFVTVHRLYILTLRNSNCFASKSVIGSIHTNVSTILINVYDTLCFDRLFKHNLSTVYYPYVMHTPCTTFSIQLD